MDSALGVGWDDAPFVGAVLVVLATPSRRYHRSIQCVTMFAESLENRARTMSNEMVKIDLLVSSALGLNPDIERVARAENFVEDGKVDVRRD